jgi:hypothetical protein
MTRRFLGIVAFGLATVWGVSGCTSTTATKTKKTNKPAPQASNTRIQDYYPLQVGDRRVYRIRYGSSKKTIQRTIQITKKQGSSYFDNQRGSYQVDAYGLRGNKLRYLLKYPLQKGKRWLSVTGVTTVERYQIIDTNRTLTVPAGTYRKCIVVRSTQRLGPQGTLEAYHYYAPKIGPVKIATSLKSGRGRLPQWSLELVAYYPAKQ